MWDIPKTRYSQCDEQSRKCHASDEMVQVSPSLTFKLLYGGHHCSLREQIIEKGGHPLAMVR